MFRFVFVGHFLGCVCLCVSLLGKTLTVSVWAFTMQAVLIVELLVNLPSFQVKRVNDPWSFWFISRGGWESYVELEAIESDPAGTLIFLLLFHPPDL